MRRNLKEACLWVVPMAMLAGCGVVTAPSESEGLAQSEQGVLYAPPTPASGNIYDSTTNLGSVALGSAVQTYFTTNPQYYSFKLQVPASSQVKLEVTHLGSSMYLDTGLFVYGPKNASGSYGTTVLAQDDDAGYGQLSKISALALAQGGEYLVVVSSGTGAGKQFRLQTSCIGGGCVTLAPPPANYSLTFTEQPIASALQSKLTTLDALHDYNRASLRRFDYAWSYSGEPSLDKAVEAVQYDRDYSEYFEYGQYQDLTYAAFFEHMGWDFEPLHPDILATYGNGIENVQVRHYSYDRLVAPGATGWFNLFVIHFPQSHKVIVYQMSMYET